MNKEYTRKIYKKRINTFYKNGSLKIIKINTGIHDRTPKKSACVKLNLKIKLY